MNYNKENDAINDLNSAYELIRKIGSEALSYQPEVAEQPQVEVQPQLPKENEWSLLGKSFLRGLVDPTAGAGTYLKQKGFDNALTNWMSESSYDDLTKGTSMQIGDYAKLGKDRSVYDAWLNWGNEATRMNIAATIGGGIGSMLNFIGVGKLAGLATGQVLKQGAKALAKNVATTGAEEVAKATVKEGAWQTVGKTLKNNATDIAGGAMAGLYEGAGNIGSTIKDMWNPNNLNPATGKPYIEQEINEAVSRYESQQLPMDALLGSVQLGALFGKTGIPKAIRNIENPVGRALGTGAVRMGLPALEEGYQELLQTRGQNDMMNPTGEGFFSRLSFIPRNAEERDAMIAGALIGGGTGGAMSLYNRYQEGKAADFQNQVNELMHGVPFQNKITHNNLADIVETVETGAGTNPVLKTLVEANANLPLSQRAAAYSKSLSEMEELPTEVAGLASGKTLDKRTYAQNKTQEINELDKLQRVMNSYSNEDTTSLSMPRAKEKLSYLRNAPKAEIESMVNNGQFVPDEVLIKNGMKTPNHIRAERASELHSSVNQIINDTSLSDDHKAKKIYDIITSNAHEAGNAYVEAKRLATAKDVGKGAIKEADYVRAEENARNQDYILDSLEQTPELQELANRIQNPTLKERFNQLLTSNVSPVSRVVMNKFLTNKDAFKNVEDFNTKINKLGTRTSFFTQNNEQSQRMFRDLQEGYDIRGAEHGVVKTPTGRVVAHWNIFDNSIQTGKHESSHIMDALAGHISLRSNLVKDFVKTNAGNIVNLYIENQRALGNENVDVQQLTQELSSGNFASDLSKSLVREVLADISMGKDYVLKDGKYVSLKEETDKVASGLREMMETHEGMKKFVNWFVDGTSKSYARVLQQNIKDMPVGQNINDTAYLRYQVDELGASKPLNKSLELVSIYHKQRMIKKFNQFYSNPDLFNQSKIEMGYHNNGELAITFDNSLTIPLKNIQQSSTVTKLKQNNIDVNYNYLMTNLQQLANKERDRLQNYYLTLEPLVNSFGEKLLRSLNVNLNSNSLITSQSRIWKTHILMSLSSGPLRLKLQNILGETNEIVADSNYEIGALLILSDLKKNEKIKDFFKLEQIPQTFGIQYQFYVPFIKSDLTNGLYNTDIFVIDNDNNLKIYEVKPGYEIVSNKNVQSKANKIKQYLDFYNNKNELFRDMIKNGIDIDNSQLSDEQKNVLMAFIKTLDEIKKYSKKTLESDIQDIKYSFFDESDIQNYFTQENKDGIKYSDFVSNKMKEMNDNYKKHISGKNMNKVLSLRKQLDNIEIEGNQIKKQIKKLQEKKKIKYDDLLDTELKVNQTRLIELRENRIDIIEKLKEMDMWNLGSDMITDENYNRWKPLHKNLITGIYVDENVQEAKEKLSTQYPLSLYRGFKKTSELFTNMRNIIQNSPQKKFANNSQGLQQLKNVFKKAGLKDTAIETANLEEVFKEVSEFKDLPNNVVTADAVDYWLQRFKPIVAIRSTSHQTRFMEPEYNVTLNGYKETSYHAQSENTPYILPSPHSFYFTDQNTSDRFAHARSSMAFARFEDGTNNGYVHLIEEVQSDDAGFATNSKKSWPNKIKELQSKIDGIAKLKIQEANIELQGDDNNGKIFINGIEYGIYEPDWRGEGLDIYIENNYIYLNEIGNRKLINKQDVLDYLNKPESRRDVYKVLIDEIGGLGIEKDLLQRLIDESNEYGTKTLTRKDFDALNDWVTPVLKDQILQALENEESNGIAITSPDVQAVRWAEPDKAPKPEAYQFYNTYFKQIGQILKKYIPNIKPTRFTVGDNKLNGYMFDKNLDRKDVRKRIENDGIAYRGTKGNYQQSHNLFTNMQNILQTNIAQKQWSLNSQGLSQLQNALKRYGVKDSAIFSADFNLLWEERKNVRSVAASDWGEGIVKKDVISKEEILEWLSYFRPVVSRTTSGKETGYNDKNYNISLDGYRETTYHALSEGKDYYIPNGHKEFYQQSQNEDSRFAHARSSVVSVFSNSRRYDMHFVEELQSDDVIGSKDAKGKWPKQIVGTKQRMQIMKDYIANPTNEGFKLDGDIYKGRILLNGVDIGEYSYYDFGSDDDYNIYFDNFYHPTEGIKSKQDLEEYLWNESDKISKTFQESINYRQSEIQHVEDKIKSIGDVKDKLFTKYQGEEINDWAMPVIKDQLIQALEDSTVQGIIISSPKVQEERWDGKPGSYNFYNGFIKQLGQIIKQYIPNVKPTTVTLESATHGGMKFAGFIFDENVYPSSSEAEINKAMDAREKVAEQIKSDGIAYRAKKPGGLNPQATRNMLTDVREVVFTQSSHQFQRNQDAMQTLRNAGWTESRNNNDIVFTRPNPEPSHNRRRIITGLIADETKERIVDYKSVQGIKEQVFRMWDNIQTNWVEELQPLKALGREIPQMYDIYEDAWIAQRGWTGKVKKLIEFGIQSYDLHDGQGRVDIKPLKDILQNINEEEISDLDNYLIAKRVIDLSNRNEPIQEAMTVTEAQDIIRNARPTFVQAQKDLVNLQRYLLRQLVESGIIKESSYIHFINIDPNYVPLFKDFGEEELQGAVGQINGRSFVNVSSPIKKIKGDTQHDTLSPVQSILKHMYQFHSLAERNKVGQKFVALRALPHMQDILYSVSGPSDRTDNVFSVWENGERKYYETTRDLYNALTSINTRQADLVLTMLQKPAHWLRMGATMSPDFAIRNFVRDQFTAWLFSKSGYLPFVDAIRGVAHIAKKDAIYQQYLSSGAAHADIVSLDRNYLQKNVRQMVRSENVWKKVTKNPVTIARAVYETFGKAGSYFRDVSQNLEMATRVAEFENALKKGKTEKQAALESRDITLDFSRAGTVGKKINRYIAFFNASIQGTDKLRREIVARPGTMAMRFSMIALVSAAIWYMNHDDDRVKELPRWQKDLFWIFPSKDYLVRIPKPFEPGLIFGTGTERFLSWWKDNDPNAWKAFGKTLLGGMTPNIIFTALQPAMEAATNYSIFRERNIVPQAEEKFAPYMQYGPYTSELAKTVGKTFNWSPRKVDHLIQGYFGTMGGTILKTSTQATNAVTGKQLPDQRANEWVPGLTAFTAIPYQSPQTIQDLYEREKELEQIRNEVKAKNKTVKEYPMNEHERLKTAIDTIGKMNKMAKEIIANDKLSSEEKRSRLDKIKLKELEIAQKAMKKN